ncbi:MAG: phosphomannomutase/phosphoglucomutase [Acidobacteriota bacterium]|nr:phosphomannomutase/phosphoglucomutase [Acidobacteriota bacterium]MDQ7087029.1 phosphomannomutase/phosphoglucomutase [Acidobacteriota bacterium]
MSDLRRVFKAYDVRGAYPEAIDEPLARRIGRATAVHLGARTALVGHDMRRSSPSLAAALIDGLREQGTDVTFIGEASSPLVYYAGRDFDAAVAVTASHNPLPDNGMKICGPDAEPIGSANGLWTIRDLVAGGDFPAAPRRGTLDTLEPRRAFVDDSLAFLHLRRRFRVVVDGANGMGGPDYQELARRDSPLEILPLYLDPDDDFPHHEPNPLVFDNLRDLQAEVRRTGADLGIALDGDGDRCVFVDEQGAVVTADLATALIAPEVLREHPGTPILFDVRSSRVVAEEIRAAGGRPVECRVGHAFIKKALRDEQAHFGGELSGHFYFREAACAENTLLALFRLLNLLDRRGCTLSQAVAPLRRYHSSGEINSRVDRVENRLQALRDKYRDGEISTLDGLKVSYSTWWFNVRPSNTEPLLRLVVEAADAEELQARTRELLTLIRNPLPRSGPCP